MSILDAICLSLYCAAYLGALALFAIGILALAFFGLRKTVQLIAYFSHRSDPRIYTMRVTVDNGLSDLLHVTLCSRCRNNLAVIALLRCADILDVNAVDYFPDNVCDGRTVAHHETVKP